MKSKLASLFLYGVTTAGVGAVLATGALAVTNYEAEPISVEVPVLELSAETEDRSNRVESIVGAEEEHSNAVEKEEPRREPIAPTQASSEKPTEGLKPEDYPGFMTRPIYIAKYKGLCPSQQPQDSAFYQDNHYQAAIGAYTDGYNVRSVLEQEWEYNKSGRWGVEGTLPVDTLWNLHVTDGDPAAYHTYLYVNWDTYEAWWYNKYLDYDRTNYYEKFGTAYPIEWDEVAAEATRYLHYLEDTYNAHCPND